MKGLFDVLPWSAASLFSVLTILWVVSVRMKDTSIIDIFWGMGFVLVSWISFFFGSGEGLLHLLLPILASVWGIRLTIFLFLRNWGNGEDYRYQAFREKVGPSYWWKSLFFVFYFQGTCCLLIALPLMFGIASKSGSSPTLPVLFGGLLWGIGMFFEIVADDQMAAFRKNPENQGKIMNRGIWRFSRHPNYFGESTLWWGIYISVLSLPSAAWMVISPLLITFMIVKVTGVANLERHLRSRKPGYAEYVQTTSMFFPWPPKD